jgi:GNAT superfamily N-acetyltransferase
MQRNKFVEKGWVLNTVEDLSVCDLFDCGDKDLNEYFHTDVKWHRAEFLTRTYCLYKSSDPDFILALLDFCNDKIQLGHRPGIDPRIPYAFLPAVKLTRFGVTKELQRKNIGTHALNLVKQLFKTDNRTGCRYITVDSYNTTQNINFYEKNGFPLFSNRDKENDTRSLYFDLKRY